MRRFYDVITPYLQNRTWGQALLENIRLYPKTWEYAEALFVALLLAGFIRTFLFQPYKIPSESMVPTLLVKDRLFVYRLPYWFGAVPKRGDIIVFKVPKTIPRYDPKKAIYIKRVVGLPGEELEVKNGRLHINGKPVDDPPLFKTKEYTNVCSDVFFTKTKVPDDQVYVFGDNTRNSYDSRGWGGVPLKSIIGKAKFRYWPFFPWRVAVIP